MADELLNNLEQVYWQKHKDIQHMQSNIQRRKTIIMLHDIEMKQVRNTYHTLKQADKDLTYELEDFESDL